MATFVGGAAIGWVTASMPLASLEATRERLRLRVLAVGTYEFRPEEVLSIGQKRGFLLFGGGLEIRHVVPKYPPSIVFHGGSVEAILSTGFAPAAPPAAAPPPRPAPWRWPVLLAALAVYVGLLVPYFVSFISAFQERRMAVDVSATPMTLAAVGYLSAGAWGLRLGPLRPLILKPGRDFEEIKHWVNLVCLIVSFMLPIFVLIALFGHRR